MPEERWRQILDGSGFPLQLAIEEAIAASRESGWQVIAREHPWTDYDGAEGFIDLIIKKTYRHSAPFTSATAVIECKRVQDTSWVFPIGMGSGYEQRRQIVTLCLPSRLQSSSPKWGASQLDPMTWQAEFGAIQGSGSENRRSLERWSGDLLRATEAFGKQLMEEAEIGPQLEIVPIVVPVIVTTATLVICRIADGGVSLETGKVERGEYQEVPWVRFRKPLSSNGPTDRGIRGLREETERTILVVNSRSLVEALEAWVFKFSSWKLTS
jgi:hypothetical protein